MKILYIVSPYALDGGFCSAIQEYSVVIENKLKKHYDDVRWVNSGTNMHRDGVKYFTIDDLQTAIKDADINHFIYMLGNSFEFHANIEFIKDKYDGIAILHDTSLSDYAHSLYMSGIMPERVKSKLINAGVGIDDLLNEVYRLSIVKVFIADYIHVYTNSEYAHNKLGIDSISVIDIVSNDKFIGIDKFHDSKHVILLIGRHSESKYVYETLKILKENNLYDYYSVIMIGGFSTDAYKIRCQPYMEGCNGINYYEYVDDSQLRHALSMADIIINYRNPSYGSMSSISDLAAQSKALLVVHEDSGKYKENSVIKLKAHGHLLKLLEEYKKDSTKYNFYIINNYINYRSRYDADIGYLVGILDGI